MTRADLHSHSTFSDGTDTPIELIQLAREKGLIGLSITDHDTVAAYNEETLAYAQAHQLSLLCGVEFSAAYQGEPVHILGYGFNLTNPQILDLCQRHQGRREKRNARILEKLSRLGFQIAPEEIPLQVLGSSGRPHIAQVLCEKGYVRSVQEAFERYLGEGKPAYDAGDPVSVEETIETIHIGKGKAILAHPHLMKKSSTVRAMLKMNFDGLEGYYARFTLAQSQKWIALANQKNWIITGGSDYHGTTKPYSLLGSSWVSQEVFQQLYDHSVASNAKT